VRGLGRRLGARGLWLRGLFCGLVLVAGLAFVVLRAAQRAEELHHAGVLAPTGFSAVRSRKEAGCTRHGRIEVGALSSWRSHALES
jgi:hypothetical protein